MTLRLPSAIASMATLLTVPALLASLALACSPDTNSEEQDGGPPQGDPNTVDASASPADASSGDVTDASLPPPGSRDPIATSLGTIPITLATPLDPAKSYRFAIAWFQFDDDGPDPDVEIALDQPFDPNATSVQIDGLLGPSQANLLCTRDSDDESKSPCRADSPYKLGLGALFLAEDKNNDGKVEVDYSGNGEVVRTALGVLVYSEKGGDVLPLTTMGQPELIDGAIPAGATLYESYEVDAGFDRLRARTGPLTFATEGPNLD